MGSEMSCPCGNRPNIKEETPVGNDLDIIEKLQKTRLSEEDLLFTCTSNSARVCLIENERIEQFFNNKKFFKYDKINEYYNNVQISNYLFNLNLCLIILHYNVEKKNNYLFYDNISKFKINDILFSSNETNCMLEEVNNNLNLMLRKDYIFFGILNFSDKLLNNYKFLYRKTLKYNNQVTYYILPHKGELTYDEIEKYIKSNIDKVLVSVMKTYTMSKDKNKKIIENIMVFKKTISNEVSRYDYLLTEVVKDKYTEFSVYLKDISSKMNLFQDDESVKFNLTCCINNDSSLFLIFYEKLDNEDTYDYNDQL